MTLAATVPVTITPEADARLTVLGLHADAQRMIDYTLHHLPEVSHVEVVLNERYDLGGEPGVAIDVYSRRTSREGERWQEAVIDWRVSAFPPEVLEHILVDYHPGAEHAG